MKLVSAALLLLLSIQTSAQSTFGDLPEGNTPACTVDTDCPPVNCFVAPCPATVCVDGSCQVEANPPNPECVQDSDCPPIQCLVAPCDVPVCNAGLCELQASEDTNGEQNLVTEGLPEPVTLDRREMSRDECTLEGGSIVGDIGNGAIHREDYVCESNGQPPIGTIVPGEGEPIATEGEVCCGPPMLSGISREECTLEGGTIVGDIGNGAIHQPDYVCESNGQPPIGTIVPEEGEPIATEGEVCCGPPTLKSVSRDECINDFNGVIVGDIGDGAIHAPNYLCESNGESPIAKVVPGEGEPIASEGEVCCGPSDTETVPSVTDGDATPAPSPEDEDTTSGAGSAFQSIMAAVVLASAVFLQTFVDFFIEDAEELFASNPVLLYQRSTSM